MKKTRAKTIYLSGFYDPNLVDNLEAFEDSFSYGANAEVGWIWFEGYYSLDQIKKAIKNPKPDDVFSEEDYKNENS